MCASLIPKCCFGFYLLTLNPIKKKSSAYCRYEAVKHAMNEDETNLGLRLLMNQNSLNNCCTFLLLYQA